MPTVLRSVSKGDKDVTPITTIAVAPPIMFVDATPHDFIEAEYLLRSLVTHGIIKSFKNSTLIQHPTSRTVTRSQIELLGVNEPRNHPISVIDLIKVGRTEVSNVARIIMNRICIALYNADSIRDYCVSKAQASLLISRSRQIIPVRVINIDMTRDDYYEFEHALIIMKEKGIINTYAHSAVIHESPNENRSRRGLQISSDIMSEDGTGAMIVLFEGLADLHGRVGPASAKMHEIASRLGERFVEYGVMDAFELQPRGMLFRWTKISPRQLREQEARESRPARIAP